jgi:hypothetical protein
MWMHRFESGGGRGGGRFGYNGRGGGQPPQGPYPPEVQERGPPAKRQRSVSGYFHILLKSGVQQCSSRLFHAHMLFHCTGTAQLQAD